MEKRQEVEAHWGKWVTGVVRRWKLIGGSGSRGSQEVETHWRRWVMGWVLRPYRPDSLPDHSLFLKGRSNMASQLSTTLSLTYLVSSPGCWSDPAQDAGVAPPRMLEWPRRTIS